ncbi:hypothetical protein [uncultured Psychroserpens sp.]|uniref:hypothetical protein n=1 Tax=uncultured Psychroserpens sp. TaxID=255436 RepID=UPI002603E35E|nr:hypothetical protein [uncultured Psychroserpens sp.]
MKQSIITTICFALVFISCKKTITQVTDQDITLEDMPPIETYEFGFGGDLNDDGKVSDIDMKILHAAFDNTIMPFAELDINRDHLINTNDIIYLEEILNGKRSSLLYADFIEDDIETGEPAELIIAGTNFNADTKVKFLDQIITPSKVITNRSEVDSLYVYFERLPEISEEGALVSVQSNHINTLAVPVYRFGMTAGNMAFSEISEKIMYQEIPEIPKEKLELSKSSCCITHITFKGIMPDIRIAAYNDSGAEAEGSGLKLKPGKNARLRSKAKNITVIIYKDNVPFETYNFNCNNIEKKVYKENFTPATDGTTQVRPQDIFEIVDFKIQDPCETKSMPFPKDIIVGTLPRDNADWDKPKPHKGSGALTRISVPLTSVAEMECTKACWVQYVSTTITKAGDRKPLYDSKGYHIDNETLEKGSDWYCYQAQQEKDGNLVLTDGPHIVHNDTIWVGGKRVVLNKGDVIIRKSFFITELICIDPTPEKVLAAFSWSVTTTYTVDPDNLNTGGVTDTTKIRPINLKVIPNNKDKNKFKAKLRKKKRDKKKCPD